MEQETPAIIQQLVDMGFELEKVKVAYQNVKEHDNIDKVIEYLQNDQNSQDQQQQPEEKQKTEQTEQKENQDQEDKMVEENQQSDLKPISEHVDQGLAQQLQDMGQTKNVAEKALFMTQNKKSIDAALDWIQEHQDDEDFDEQLFIQGNIPTKSKLSPEEARIKAKEMQAALRLKRAGEEEAAEFDREKRRREMGKQMGDTTAQLKEAQKQRDIEQNLRDREIFAREKKKMQEKLDQDYIDRWGMEKFKKWKITNQEVKKTPVEVATQNLKAIVAAHPHKVFPDKAMTTLKTIKIYIEAIIKNPYDEKYRKVNSQNAGFKKRVGDSFSGQSSLESCGFVLQTDGFLFLQTPDFSLLKEVVSIIEALMITI